VLDCEYEYEYDYEQQHEHERDGKGMMAGIALQLYTLREPAREDLSATLKRMRAIGWEYVQWSGMPNLPADRIPKSLDAAGLKAIAVYCGMEPFEQEG